MVNQRFLNHDGIIEIMIALLGLMITVLTLMISAYPVASASHYLLGLAFGGQPGYVLCSSNIFIRCRGAASPKTEQGLERSHRCPATVVAENELIQINLELVPAHAVIGSNEPLLQIANSAVCQRYC